MLIFNFNYDVVRFAPNVYQSAIDPKLKGQKILLNIIDLDARWLLLELKSQITVAKRLDKACGFKGAIN